ncbi:hypothetical protein UlMin_027317 [Ulmus minor]
MGNYNARNCNSGNYNRGNNPYSNTYNPGWRQHPNFSWSNQTWQSSNNPNKPINPNASAPPGFQQQQGQRPQFPAQSAPQERSDSLESMMRAFMNKTETHIQNQGDMLTKKRRFGEFETVALTRECSATLQSRLPPKLQDPGSFTIPCYIGGQYCGKALCDLGASINLMPMSIFKTLGIGEARPTTVSLQLADRSIAQPEGKI